MRTYLLFTAIFFIQCAQGQTFDINKAISINGYATSPDVREDETFAELLDYCAERSVHRRSVDWSVLRLQAQAVYDTIGLLGAMQHVLFELGDFHGRVWYQGLPYNGLTKPYVNTALTIDSLTLAQYRQTSLSIKGAVLEGEIGYVFVPGMVWGAEDSAHAHELYHTIATLEEAHHPRGWVIDLRLNGGGTMFPMLCGLGALLGEDPLGAFVDTTSHYKETWHLSNGEFFLDSLQVTDYGVGRPLDLSHKPVAVLLSSGTTSSGEVVALAFKHRPNTCFIGEPTGGYTTTVSWLELGNGLAFQLTESWYADRNGHVYEGTPVEPDFLMYEGDNIHYPHQDEWVLRGIQCLKR